MRPYLFIVRGTNSNSRGRGARVIAPNFKNALKLVTALHPNKKIQTKFARTMDLITAKKEAIAKSKAQKKTIYVNVKEADGECYLHHIADNTSHAAYYNGSEIALPVFSKTAANKPDPILNEKNRKDRAKGSKKIEAFTPEPLPQKNIKDKPATKQAAKTKVEESVAPAKKSTSTSNKNNTNMATAVKTKTAAKKAAPEKKNVTAPKGKTKEMAVKAILALVKKGAKAYNENAKPLPERYLAKMTDQARVIKVTIVE